MHLLYFWLYATFDANSLILPAFSQSSPIHPSIIIFVSCPDISTFPDFSYRRLEYSLWVSLVIVIRCAQWDKNNGLAGRDQTKYTQWTHLTDLI